MLIIAQWFETIVPSPSIRYYVISLAGLGVAFVLFRARHLLGACVLWFSWTFLYYFKYLVIIPRRFRRWCRFTLLQSLIFVVFLAVNCFCIGYDHRNDLSVVASRCAILSVINMVPLFMAGRSNTIVSALSLPLHVHQLIHNWLGRLSIVQAFFHIIFVRTSRQGKQIPSGATVSPACTENTDTDLYLDSSYAWISIVILYLSYQKTRV